MARASHRFALACGALAGIIVASAAAQAQTIYRYVDPDGHIIYSDHTPPANAKDVQAKRLNQNFIETDQVSLAGRQAQDRYPVTLYTFACGTLCDNAEALLNRRGVPFTKVNVQDPKGAERLKQLTGELQVPVLQAGDKLLAKGFSDAQWQALLDDAGYPKTPPLRRTQPLKPAEPKDAAAEPAAAPPPAPSPAPAAAGSYPKQ